MRRSLPKAAILAFGAHAAFAGGTLVTVTDSLESASPGAINGQTTAPLWSDPRITGLTLWRGTTAPGRAAEFATDAIGGNGSVKAKLDSVSPIGAYSFGWRAELLTHNSPPRRAVLAAGLEVSAWIEAEVFVTSAASTWELAATNAVNQGFVARALIGGPCDAYADLNSPSGHCDMLGLPAGVAAPMIVGFAPHPSCATCPSFHLLRYLESAPVGVQLDDPALAPLGAWCRLRIELSPDAYHRFYLDLMDGNGPYLVGELWRGAWAPFDSVQANGTFLSAGSPVYFDNLTASGVLQLCDGDADGDSDVDFDDLSITLNQFRTEAPGLGADFNGDQRVDFADLNILLGRFNQPCE